MCIRDRDRTGAVRSLVQVYNSRDEAYSEALANLSKSTKNAKALTFTTDGTLAITADRKIKVTAKDKDLNGKIFLVTSANYDYSKGKLKVTYNCEGA